MSALRLPRLWVTIAALASVGVGSGCGHTRQIGSDRTTHLALTEYRVNPQSMRSHPGLLTIVIHNNGRLTHNLVVTRSGQTVAETKPIMPGQWAELDLDLAAGSYVMASTLLSDQALGQYGTLTVR